MDVTVIFVEPESAGNVGSMARVMANFGLRKLILVKPRCKVNVKARAMAMHGWDIAKAAKVTSSFSRAAKRFDFVVGTTGKVYDDYNLNRAFTTPKQLARRVKETKGNIALVFGRESRGLTNKELERCDVVVHIPSCPAYPIMNVTHAAAIIFYELFDKADIGFRKANRTEREILFKLYLDLAKRVGMNYPHRVTRIFRNVINRSFISGREAHGIAGVLRKASRRGNFKYKN